MKTVLLVVVLAVAISSSVAIRPGGKVEFDRIRFDAFREKFGKTYATADELETRFNIFLENLIVIQKLNAKNDGATYGITQFADLTKEEFTNQYLMKTPPPLNSGPVSKFNVSVDVPATFNWVGHNPPVVTPVYNQGQCGSCWAFSATENIESRWALAGHPLVSLAMQQIVDCDTSDYGCSGGWPYNAYKYVISAGGMDPLADYPYVAVNEACRFQPSEVVAKISSWEYVTTNQNEEQMRSYLVAKGPLSVCVDASNWSFYTGGIFPASSCSTSIDHCVQATGFDVTNGYWIIRNSWGTSWGLQGFMQLQYGQNACAVAQVVTSSIA